MRRPSKRQTGHGWGKAVVGLLKPLMSKVLAKSLMKRGSKAKDRCRLPLNME